MLNTDGIVKLGRANEKVEEKSGLLSRIFGNDELDEYYAERILDTLAKEASSPANDERVNAEQLEAMVLFIKGSDRYLIDSGIEAAIETAARHVSVDPAVGVFPRREPTITVTTLYSGISDADILARFEQVYRDNYAGPSNGDPKPPFHLSSQSSLEPQKQSSIDTASQSTNSAQSTGAPGGTTVDSEPTEDFDDPVEGEAVTKSPTENSHNKTETGTRDTPEQSWPDPPDVDGVEQPPRLTFEDVIGLNDVITSNR